MFLYFKNILVAKTAHLIGCSIGKYQISCFVSLTEKLSLALLSFGLYLCKMVSLKQRHRLTMLIKILTAKGANIGTTVQMPQYK
jgi:hypothetical protein